jgi:hypothetical protein
MRDREQQKQEETALRWLGACVADTNHPHDVEFFRNFCNIDTVVEVPADEIKDTQLYSPRINNAWIPRRYSGGRRVYSKSLGITDIGAILSCLDESIAEPILLLGVSTAVRCVLGPAYFAKAPLELSQPSAHVLMNLNNIHRNKPLKQTWHDHLALCNERLHNADSDNYEHSKRFVCKHDCEHIRTRRALCAMLPTYVSLEHKAKYEFVVESEYTRSEHLDAKSIVSIFAAMSTAAEQIFVLGCAAALRNLITCLQAILRRDPKDDDRYSELRWYFSYCNTKNVELGMKTGQQFHERLDTYYRMLCDIIHGLDAMSSNRFFYDENFIDRFDTIRWEVLHLLFTFLVKLPDNAPVRNPHFLHALVGGPDRFFEKCCPFLIDSIV